MSTSSPLRLTPLGDRAVVLHLADPIDEKAFQQVRTWSDALERDPPPGMVEFVPAYTTITVYYDPVRTTPQALSDNLQTMPAKIRGRPAASPRAIKIPVCYGGEFGCDLEFVAEHNRLSPGEAIELHSSAEYRVHMIGFVPGFPYLGGMPERIAAPRLASPRLKVPAGSVGIAGLQTGIYPLETPGGWQLIGRTPLALFRPTQSPPSLLQAGDLVRFYPITPDEYHALREADA